MVLNPKVLKVKILGQDYVVRSSAGQKYLNEVSSYMNEKMNEVISSGIDSNSQQLKIAVLAGMNITDELFAQKESQKKLIDGFEPVLKGFTNVEFGDHKAIEKSIDNQTAAIMLEPILGEGGIKVIPSQCLEGLRKLCNKKNILLIFDEVQCGIGRSGKFFSYQWSKIKPDILTTAKGIGGGFPIGACLVSNKVSKGMGFGSHGSTFGGNPLACSVANKVIEIISNKKFLKDLNKKSVFFINELEKIKNLYGNLIEEIRGQGFLLGIKSKINNLIFIEKLRKNGLLIIGASENVIRILPPLNVSIKELKIAINIIKKTCLDINGKKN